jgi:hypothetical protein
MTEISNPNDPVEQLLGMRNLAQAWAGDSNAGTSLQMLAIQAYAAPCQLLHTPDDAGI